MAKDFTILVVDDEVRYQEVYKILLTKKGYNVKSCSSGEEAMKLLEHEEIDLVLTDLKMKNMTGLKLLEEVKEKFKDIEVIVITGYGTIESAVEAMKKGAFSYYIKSHNPETLLLEIDKLVRIKVLEKENSILKKMQKNGKFLLETKNEKFQEVIHIAQKAALSNSSILILGESGTGKEVLARYIHNISLRRDNNFVAVNCHVFSDGLLESELFGHEKAAFTGATEKRIGRFEEADGGTLFLDEIGDMPINTQIKLLRAIDTKSIERIGSNRNIPIDLRFISATNRDIKDAIYKNHLREDLLYRVNTITINIPPLRERKEDLPKLIEFFIGKTENELKKKVKTIDDDVLFFLNKYEYPGNIRELKNIIERLVVLSEDGVIKKDYLPMGKIHTYRDLNQKKLMGKSLKEARKIFEAFYINEIFKESKRNVSVTAKKLGITTRHLSNKINEYKIRK
ncbi:sigma-54-dependent transcriptional regulator [Clostridiisalibacter paucivorans]|uniref:sigma-54-dependent transcriptional regulator n=1 Tax=Clostridiisalibacter paucivorans TaxID=408753 RepID=UPI00047A25B1|nr:sigma-54 dependent transcriptional regulator [Clostridiisalibacter paucivorans]